MIYSKIRQLVKKTTRYKQKLFQILIDFNKITMVNYKQLKIKWLKKIIIPTLKTFHVCSRERLHNEQ